MRIFLMLLFSSLFYNLDAQINLSYQTPHEDILSLADANPAPQIRIDDKAKNAFLLKRNMYKDINELSKEEMRLGGLRIDPNTYLNSRLRYAEGIIHLAVESGKESPIIGLPAKGKFSNLSWSPDQKNIAVINATINGVELYIINVDSKKANRVLERGIHGALGKTFTWLDNDNLLVKMLPKTAESLVNRDNSIPSGPTISENDGQKAQNRTYQDLLKNPVDEDNFSRLTTSEIWKISIAGEKSIWLGQNMWDDMNLSPDGDYVMMAKIEKPFSYIVPYYRFPYQYEIYDKNGKLIKDLFKIPLIEEMPQGFMAVTTHPRRMSWRADHPATIFWAEALDNGDPEKEVEFRDAVFQLSAPFSGKKALLAKTKERYSGISWCDENFAVMYAYWWNTRNSRISSFNPSDNTEAPQLIQERNYQDKYSDPGSFAYEKNSYGRYILTKDEGNLYLLGDGYSEKGKFPFVDKYNIASASKERLFQAKTEDKLEDFSNAIDIKSGLILTRIESKNEYPNYYLRNFKSDELTPVTHFENPFKELNNVHKEVINYKRTDGLDLSATLYLPVGYDLDKKEKMPMLMWAYPREFKDKGSAGQTTNNPNEFTFPYYGSPIYWVNRGYAVLDDAAFPIVGEGDTEPNDSFRDQLVANAKAAIDAVDELGYIDRNRVGVGGHSYGAFMTANLLSHSDLFAAGIARSGAYNRTLTPFGFQSEERNYWEAPEIYNNMSPFMHADKMKTPMLLIHGEEDNNSGTYPMQSERYFNALKGHGATVRLVMLPKESHGYAARESIMHLLWEQDQWLAKYVKHRASIESIQP
jgi:dipeptidyl aminopeptidase/acylaminoacyl peptidase